MARLPAALRPSAYWLVAKRTAAKAGQVFHLNYRGATWAAPGNFYSPLLDIAALPADGSGMPFDGQEYWEGVDLRPDAQRAFYQSLIEDHPAPAFPAEKSPGFRYYTANRYFPFADAFTLSGVIQSSKPRRIVEVGSGYSTAVMLDTADHASLDIDITCIEPYPDRLRSLLSERDAQTVRILVSPVQAVPLATFEALEAGDLLFIDSSHVAKVGSDVVHLLLRVLPRLRVGVVIHVHDMFYPCSYPDAWVREGRAWNESLFLRAFLTDNPHYEVIAFNSFAGQSFPELFNGKLPGFLPNSGGSFYFRKRSA